MLKRRVSLTPLSQLSLLIFYLLSLGQIVLQPPTSTPSESCNPQLCLCPCIHCTADRACPLCAHCAPTVRRLPCSALSVEVGGSRMTKISYDTGAISKEDARIPARGGGRKVTADQGG